MAVRPEEVEAALVDTVCSGIGESVPAELAEQTEAFVRRYYHWVPQEELAGRGPGDLLGAASAQLELLESRLPGEAKVRVYNPEPERDGWQSPYTVVEIVSDDMPFLVDSVSMELTRLQYGIHLLIHPVIDVRRDPAGRLVEISDPGAEGAVPESVMHGEIDRETDPDRLEALEHSLRVVLAQVAAAVEDWSAMRACLSDAAAELAAAPRVPAGQEASAFLEWLRADKFVFLGYREYALVRVGGEDQLEAVEGTGLGILRHGGDAPVSPSFANPSARVRARARDPEPLVLTKADSRSPVHRPLYLDYVGVKRFAASGAVIGERRFVGLYTTTAEKASIRDVPVLRGKVDAVLRRAGFPPASHDSKALLDILESYPRDELFPIDEDELFDAAMAILALGERQRVRLLVRHDAYERFVSCLVYVPRDRFNTANREAIETVLRDAFAATSVDWTVRVSESVLVRLHFVVRLGPDSPLDLDVREVEDRLVAVTRSWTDDLRDVLHATHDNERADVLFQRYRSAFPPAYRADYPARRTVDDIIRVELAAASGRIDMRVYQPPGSAPGSLRCKLYSPLEPVILSDILPIFELMGAQVADERPYEVRPRGHPPVWIYDLRLIYPGEFEIDSMAFRDAFIGVWSGELENDHLGALVGKVGLPGREVSLLRAIAKYLRQAGMTFSDRYLQQALTENPEIARQLVELFQLRFDPARHDAAAAKRLAQEIEQAIDGVPSLDQDRILRNYLATVGAVLRTNYFQPARGYLSFKLDPSRLSFLPLPRPAFEIFVYSPRVEGIHLRGGRVARGGLRWSDRLEDFRVEVLGLMKAQTVKNALIVPVGAKGGFVVKRPPPAEGGREALRAEVVACYETFIRGLLDVTDNIVAGEVVAPDDVVRYDADDPYLVVAADRGTATLSDLANDVAAEYGFWLGDAFASGGSHGYDHKRMGITARGAWESVKRHFRELGVDTQTTDFTVAGIGDMGGDVFGNGMLLSRHIRLVAAFNHEHVFLDPNPDPATSFDERRRLFEAASSSWLDYNPELISPGGGVFSRTAKHVELSPEARAALGVEAAALTPNELIRAVLRAPLDLLWNGGIGTFVKSLAESHADVGDKANDAVRIDASELRVRVVGEGGNLGLTQRARIEFGLAGGRVYTDAIDNVAGVNTSDTEVNLKILLDGAVADGELTVDGRNEVLGELAEAVAQRVIGQSYSQTLGLSLERARAPETIDMHARLIRRLEGDGQLDRALEFLPSDEEIAERKLAGNGLTVPELAVLSAYAKNALHAVLLGSEVTDDQYLADELVESFPPSLARFRKQMQDHRLRGDIIATQLANDIVDRGGLTFAFRMSEENDVPAADIARAYATALVAFDVRGLWADVKALDGQVDAAVQYGMLFEARRLVGRVTRWLVTDSRRPIRIVSSVERIRPAAETLAELIPDVLHGLARDAWQARLDELSAAGVPSRVARRSAAMGPLFAALDVADIAGRTERSLDVVATAYFELASELELHWLADRILELPRPDLLQTLARAGLRDDLYRLRRDLTADALDAGGVDRWLAQNADAVEGSAAMLADIKLGGIFDVTTLSVALRALHKLVRLDATP